MKPRYLPLCLCALAWPSRSLAQTAPVTAQPAVLRVTVPAPATPISSPGPSTPAGSTGFTVRPGVEVFAQYALRLTNTDAGATEWFHAFELPRAHASAEGRYGVARARFVFEAVRSASEGALLGVAGDSFVFRVREAWAGVATTRWIEARAGVVPTLTIPEVESTWGLRAVAPVPAESAGLASPADLGATLRVRLPEELGWAGAGAYNGEGYTAREINRGKNLELAASLHPLARLAPRAAPLTLFASYVLGSSGSGSSRADRFTGAALWQGQRLRAGLVATLAWGLDDDGARFSYLLEAFVWAEPVTNLLVGARFSRWQRDDTEESDRVTTVLGTVGYRVLAPLEVFLAVSRQIPGARAAQALPGTDQWEFRAVTRAVF
ncbi:MAG: hypothetical protein R3A52_29355 [Polyangiales bacterium]